MSHVNNYDPSKDSSKMSDDQFMEYISDWLDWADKQAETRKFYPLYMGRDGIRRLLDIAKQKN